MEGVILILGVFALWYTFSYFVIRLEKQEGGEADGDNKLIDGR